MGIAAADGDLWGSDDADIDLDDADVKSLGAEAAALTDADKLTEADLDD